MAAQRAVYYFRVARKIVHAVQARTLTRSESQSEKGYRGQLSSVWNWLRKHGGHGKRNSVEKLIRPHVHSSPRHTAWQILKGNTFSKAISRRTLSCFSRDRPARASWQRVFPYRSHSRSLAAWPEWLEAARHTALSRFVSGLTRDQDAVEAALHLPWSNGPVEGQVHRLKVIKRQMYGRASFDLLKLRVLNKA
jgi:transposase